MSSVFIHSTQTEKTCRLTEFMLKSCVLCFKSPVSPIHLLPQSLDFGGFEVVVVRHPAVDGSFGGKFNDPIGGRLYKGMVIGSHQHRSIEINDCIVEGCDRFKVQMVGRFVHNQQVGILEHHPRYHAADFLATR